MTFCMRCGEEGCSCEAQRLAKCEEPDPTRKVEGLRRGLRMLFRRLAAVGKILRTLEDRIGKLEDRQHNDHSRFRSEF